MIEQRLFATIRDLEYEVERYKVYCNQLENELKKFDNQKTQNMNDKKQTSVKWLEMEIFKLEKDFAIPSIIYKLCEQAKAMEKEHIMDAINFGQNNHTLSLPTDNENAEQYYKENYEQ